MDDDVKAQLDETNLKLHALMGTVAAIAAQLKVDPDQVAKFIDNATANMTQPRQTQVREKVADWLRTYRRMVWP